MNNFFEIKKMEKVIDIAIQKAKELKVSVTICLMDKATVIQMLYHMPKAILVSSSLAPKKAWSAIAMNQPTKDIAKKIQPGGSFYQVETSLNGKLVSFAGGIPIKINNELQGSIGVSGGSNKEDQAICETAITKFKEETKRKKLNDNK